MLDQLAGAIGVKKGVLIAAATGALLATLIRSRLKERDTRQWLELFVTMLVGFFASVYGTEPLLGYLELEGRFEHGVAFFVGLFAMAIIDKLLSLLASLDGDFVKWIFRR